MNRLSQRMHDLSVKSKLMVAILGVSTVSMVLAGLVLYLFLASGLQGNFERDCQTLARIAAANCSGPIQFADVEAAQEILTALVAESKVGGAAITLPAGKKFVVAGSVSERWLVNVEEPVLRWISADTLAVLNPVKINGEQVGTLAVVSDYRPLHQQFLFSYFKVLILVLAGSAIVGYVLAARARNMVSTPVRELARTAQLVARTQNYNLRAKRTTGGEIGLLTDAFNNMMQRLSVGEAVAREVEERRRVEEALRDSEQRFRTVFDNATIGLYRANRDGRFLMANPALVHMVGYDSFAELAGADLSGLLYADPHCREHIMDCLVHVGMVTDTETVWRRNDGTQITVRQNIKAIRDRAGQILHFEGSVEDISVRKLAEAELQRLHTELVDASRAAGMAEVATGVLHNVGNVLNSVNVSVTLLNDQVAASKLSSLSQAVALLESNSQQLGTYLVEDPKGRLIPSFLSKVTHHVLEEQKRWLAELQQLKANVEHMKEVVAMQQSHARVAGFIEPLTAQSLMEDALRVNQHGLERRGIQISREYEPVPTVLADKHKVLQILINLIRNAEHAVTEAQPDQPHIHFKIYLNGSGLVKLQVRDNGIGIPSENLTRIFSHGFTTKPEGHGFGLHSGALAARELGGSLSVESDGPGCGATFTLELPVANQGN